MDDLYHHMTTVSLKEIIKTNPNFQT